jgi:hypothetical protein
MTLIKSQLITARPRNALPCNGYHQHKRLARSTLSLYAVPGHPRSIPCQDLPGNKMTYEAVVQVPVQNMSAVLRHETTKNEDN